MEGETSKTYSFEEAVAEVGRLETLKKAGLLPKREEQLLSLLSQWVGHFSDKHSGHS